LAAEGCNQDEGKNKGDSDKNGGDNDDNVVITAKWGAKCTRQLSYRKEDRAMRPIYGCPEKF